MIKKFRFKFTSNRFTMSIMRRFKLTEFGFYSSLIAVSFLILIAAFVTKEPQQHTALIIVSVFFAILFSSLESKISKEIKLPLVPEVRFEMMNKELIENKLLVNIMCMQMVDERIRTFLSFLKVQIKEHARNHNADQYDLSTKLLEALENRQHWLVVTASTLFSPGEYKPIEFDEENIQGSIIINPYLLVGFFETFDKDFLSQTDKIIAIWEKHQAYQNQQSQEN